MATATMAHTTRRSTRSTRRTTPNTATTVSPVSPEQARLRTHIAWLSGQIDDVDANVASMTHDYCELGERSDWRDARLPQLDETISFWRHRYEALMSQLRDARAHLMSLQAQAPTVA